MRNWQKVSIWGHKYKYHIGKSYVIIDPMKGKKHIVAFSRLRGLSNNKVITFSQVEEYLYNI